MAIKRIQTTLEAIVKCTELRQTENVEKQKEEAHRPAVKVER